MRLKEVSSWRITTADPSGMMMWFDPTTETPLLGHLPSDSELSDGYYEGGALQDGTMEEEGGVPCEGDAAKETERESYDLPC